MLASPIDRKNGNNFRGKDLYISTHIGANDDALEHSEGTKAILE